MFKIGQVWRTRVGALCRITAEYKDGCFGTTLGDRNEKGLSPISADGDLVELCNELVQPKQFKIGQVWRTRNGGIRTILDIYPNGTLRTDSGQYLPDGMWCRDESTALDLTELVEETKERPTLNMNFPCLYPSQPSQALVEMAEANLTNAQRDQIAKILKRSNDDNQATMAQSFAKAKALPEINELIEMHLEHVKRAGSRPYPSIIAWGEDLYVHGINGVRVVKTNVAALEEMKAATGYPVYVMTKHEFAPVCVYEVQS
jgi:hypothetical protein